MLSTVASLPQEVDFPFWKEIGKIDTQNISMLLKTGMLIGLNYYFHAFVQRFPFVMFIHVLQPWSIAVDLIVLNLSVTRVLDRGSTKSKLQYPILLAWLYGNSVKSYHLQAAAGTLGCSMYLLRGYVRVFTHACILWLDVLF